MAGQPGRLEGGEGLSGTGGMPDVTARIDGSVFLVVVGLFNLVDYLLGRYNLVRSHDHEDAVHVEDAVLEQHIQDGVLGQERAGEVHQVIDDLVLLRRPVGGELETVAGLLGRLLVLLSLYLLDMGTAGGVGIVFGERTVADDEYLHILEESASRPERIALVAVYLVERFLDIHAPAFQFDMDQRKTVDQYGHVIAVLVVPVLRLVLVEHLEVVVMDFYTLLLDQVDVLLPAVITGKQLYMVLLNHGGLFRYAVVRVGDDILEETLPFAVGEGGVIQFFQLVTKVRYQIRFGCDGQPLVFLCDELSDERFFECRLALVAGGGTLCRCVFHYHRALGVFR